MTKKFVYKMPKLAGWRGPHRYVNVTYIDAYIELSIGSICFSSLTLLLPLALSPPRFLFRTLTHSLPLSISNNSPTYFCVMIFIFAIDIWYFARCWAYSNMCWRMRAFAYLDSSFCIEYRRVNTSVESFDRISSIGRVGKGIAKNCNTNKLYHAYSIQHWDTNIEYVVAIVDVFLLLSSVRLLCVRLLCVCLQNTSNSHRQWQTYQNLCLESWRGNFSFQLFWAVLERIFTGAIRTLLLWYSFIVVVVVIVIVVAALAVVKVNSLDSSGKQRNCSVVNSVERKTILSRQNGIGFLLFLLFCLFLVLFLFLAASIFLCDSEKHVQLDQTHKLNWKKKRGNTRNSAQPNVRINAQTHNNQYSHVFRCSCVLYIVRISTYKRIQFLYYNIDNENDLALSKRKVCRNVTFSVGQMPRRWIKKLDTMNKCDRL